MNVLTYFTIVWYILMLPVVFRVLLAVRFDHFFKKGATVEIKLFYMIATVVISKIFVDYFIDLGQLLQQI